MHFFIFQLEIFNGAIPTSCPLLTAFRWYLTWPHGHFFYLVLGNTRTKGTTGTRGKNYSFLTSALFHGGSWSRILKKRIQSICARFVWETCMLHSVTLKHLQEYVPYTAQIKLQILGVYCLHVSTVRYVKILFLFVCINFWH